MSQPPIRSWLYAPGNNPELLEKVFGVGADAVILDLEDAVPAAEKEHARGLVARAIEQRAGQTGPAAWVRLNAESTGLTEDEVKAVVQPGLAGVRLPKVEGVDEVERLEGWLQIAEAHAGTPVGSVQVVCSLESAKGIWLAADIATASTRVVALGFGAADFARDLGLQVGAAETETLYARSRMVLASRLAGLRPPVESVYSRLKDDAGLEASTRASRALGFFGRAAIHPSQVAIINRVFTPGEDEVRWARSVLEAAQAASDRGTGALQLGTGEFIDRAILRRAEDILSLAGALSEKAG